MQKVNMFPRDQVAGVFRGFREGGLEFHADLVLPYRNDFQSVPMHGQFLLVQLESADEAVLGRIASFSSDGKLAFGAGEEFNIRAVQEGRAVPEDLREQYLKYRVNIRVLGVLRNHPTRGLTFVASHRRLPHVGSPVAFPSPDVIQFIGGHVAEGSPIGHFALGEYVYAEGSDDIGVEDWMQIKGPEVLTKFPVENLVSRRTFVFARAGFGKSNLNKLLFSQLYQKTPTVEKRGSIPVPVGTIIFDPDGEYFWPDDKGRPGLCDVPELHSQIVVFTPRKTPSDFYRSFVAGGIKLDLRRFNASDVIGIALSPEQQSQQNVRKLRGLNNDSWEKLVNLIDANGNQTPLEDIAPILQVDATKQEMEAIAARSNMTSIVKALHSKSSLMMDMLIHALQEGKICVVDVSQMREDQALKLSGLILRRIFNRNQEEFTAANPKTIPTIAVVEEAQSVLNERATSSEPYIEWVKEGRKYDLGALLITQQPGSIPMDILSQGDNWFIFHLLSSVDLMNVKRANAHFSDDLLSVLLNEPIPGQGVFWSSAAGNSYPIPIRVLSFERMYKPLDKQYNHAAVDVYASQLRRRFAQTTEQVVPILAATSNTRMRTAARNGEQPADEQSVDWIAEMEANAIRKLRANEYLMRKLRGSEGASWGEVTWYLEEVLPSVLEDRNKVAYNLVRKACNEIFGPQPRGWTSYRNQQKEGKTYIRVTQDSDMRDHDGYH